MSLTFNEVFGEDYKVEEPSYPRWCVNIGDDYSENNFKIGEEDKVLELLNDIKENPQEYLEDAESVNLWYEVGIGQDDLYLKWSWEYEEEKEEDEDDDGESEVMKAINKYNEEMKQLDELEKQQKE